jgi:superfamily II DNA/RNA helicase
VVREWTQHADNAKTICFGSTIAHCESLLSEFRSAGIGADLFTSHTTDNERRALLEEYRKPDSKIRVLISVEALAKGFDVPDVGCVIDCRPLRKSLSTWVQMVGRGLRSSPGKTECLLLDHSGNAHRFRDDFSRLYFEGLAELDAGEKLDSTVRPDEEEKAPPVCPACGFSPVGRKCIRCGFEKSRPAMVDRVAGEGVEIDLLGTGQAALKYASSSAELYSMLVDYEQGKNERRPDRRVNSNGIVAHRFRELTGQWPSREWSFATAPRVTASRKLQGKQTTLALQASLL